MGRKLSTYIAEPSERGYCEIHFDFKEEYAYIKYFDNTDTCYFTEHFPNKSTRYVTDAAENWCTGIKKLGIMST